MSQTPAVENERLQSQPSYTANERAPTVGGPYAYYVLGVLFVVYIFNFIDRQILAILPRIHGPRKCETLLR